MRRCVVLDEQHWLPSGGLLLTILSSASQRLGRFHCLVAESSMRPTLKRGPCVQTPVTLRPKPLHEAPIAMRPEDLRGLRIGDLLINAEASDLYLTTSLGCGEAPAPIPYRWLRLVYGLALSPGASAGQS